MTNYEEFLAGTDPNDASSKLLVENLTKAGVAFDLTWKSVAGHDYRVRFSTDLVTWQPWTDADNVPVTFSADGAETTARLTTPAAGSNRMFFRVDLQR